MVLLFLFSSEDVKVFVKFCSKDEKGYNKNQKRVFWFEENREVLYMQKGEEKLLNYRYDYVFSDFDPNNLICSSIKSTVTNLLRNEKNLCFLTFGEEKLGI
jgi:hypothetical protein